MLTERKLSSCCSLFVQRVMDSAEQAALSESERDSSHHHHHHQSAQVSHRLYETRHINEYASDEGKEFPARPLRRFEKLIVNLTHSSVLYPAGISSDGKTNFSSLLFISSISPVLLLSKKKKKNRFWR